MSELTSDILDRDVFCEHMGSSSNHSRRLIFTHDSVLRQQLATARQALVEVRADMDQLKQQMIEVVRTERQQVWEEAAKMVEGGRFLHDASPEAKWAYMIAKLCRKQAKKGQP
jgi:hypothetical protein